MGKEDRGFASMDRKVQKRIASMGGKAAHRLGVAHQWTREEAREAGKKGGSAPHKNRTPVEAPKTADAPEDGSEMSEAA